MTDSSPTCPDCGAALPSDSPQALCPACLMRQALASRTIVEGAEKPITTPPPSPEEIAEKFPGFEILECLGRGGMGVVYMARQKSLNRLVAIKILAPERESEVRFAERFAREAEMLAKLNHPHIVTIHDFGETGGLFYLVMEFVDGVNLRDLLCDGKLEPKQALAIVPPICEALQYAHDKGIVHRDIKPENLLLDRDGRIKIADFGIASLVGAGEEKSGTPPYMAPEQNDASSQVDNRADIFALGVVLYEMLTGERPDKEVVAPSRKVRLDVRIDEMVLRALEKNPVLRYQTAGEFRTVVQTMTIAPGPPPAGAEQLAIRASECLFATPEFLATAWGSMKLHEGMATLALYSDRLIVGRGWQTTEIPFISLHKLGVVSYPACLSPRGLRSMVVEYETEGKSQQLLLTPRKGFGIFSSTGDTNQSVAEWFLAIREVATLANGRPPSGSATPELYQGISNDGLLWAKLSWVFSGMMGLGILTFIVLEGLQFPGNPVPVLGYLPMFIFGMALTLFMVRGQRKTWRRDNPLPPVKGRPPGTELTDSLPRFSRTAIVGAVWTACSVLLVLVFVVLKNIPSGDFGLPGLAEKIFFVMLPFGVTAPLGTTILGWASIRQIRRSGGKLHGMGLAVFDGLLFPLLAINAAVMLPLAVKFKSIGFAPFPFWSFLVGGIAGLVLIIGNVLFIRWVWRKVTERETRSSSLGWSILALVAAFGITGILWMPLGRSYPASSMSPRYVAPVIGRVTFKYSHPDAASGGGSISFEVKAWGDTLWVPTSAQTIELKNHENIRFKFRVDACRAGNPLAWVTTSSDGIAWQTLKSELLAGETHYPMSFTNGMQLEIHWEPVENPGTHGRSPDPTQLGVTRQASDAANRMHPENMVSTGEAERMLPDPQSPETLKAMQVALAKRTADLTPMLERTVADDLIAKQKKLFTEMAGQAKAGNGETNAELQKQIQQYGKQIEAMIEAAGGPAGEADDTADFILIKLRGAVARPGEYKLRPDASLLDAVSAAGGWTAGANLHRIFVGLEKGESNDVSPFHDFDAILSGNAVNPQLHPGEMVIIEIEKP